MSFASEISETVSILAATRAARQQAVQHIRAETALHLKDARAAHDRMSALQRQHLGEAVRSTKLATAILLGAADEQIDGYRKARISQATKLDRELTNGRKAQSAATRKWLHIRAATRGKQQTDHLKVLRTSVSALLSQDRAFLEALAKDRREAGVIWAARADAQPPASHVPANAEAKAAAKPAAKKSEPVAAPAASADAPAKPHHAEAEPARAEAMTKSPTAAESKSSTETKPTETKAGDTHGTAAKTGGWPERGKSS